MKKNYIKRDFNGVFEEVRKHLFRIHNFKKAGSVTDKLICDAINVSKQNFINRRKRNSIFYEEVLEFCAANNIDAMSVFYEIKRV